VFYGVTDRTVHLWRQALAEGRDWFYMDNAYLDPCREHYFRVTRNRLQHTGEGDSNGARWRDVAQRFGITIRPQRTRGGHVLVCPQSDPFMATVAGYRGHWVEDTVRTLRRYTDLPVRVRPWNGDKRAWYRSLPEDLAECWCLVTYSSASAITALLAGVPAIVTAQDCISRPVADTELERVDTPAQRPALEPWLAVVADNQWTVAEFEDGTAWRMLNAAA